MDPRPLAVVVAEMSSRRAARAIALLRGCKRCVAASILGAWDEVTDIVVPSSSACVATLSGQECGFCYSSKRVVSYGVGVGNARRYGICGNRWRDLHLAHGSAG